MTIKNISVRTLQKRLAEENNLLLLDVREPYEFRIAHIVGSISMPLTVIPLRLNELDPNQEVVTICHHGMRSQQAALFLEKQGFKQLFNLVGGVDAWARECDTTMPRY